MLTQLTVSNYAIAERVELQFGKGMTALTGETGAGKSIVLDALGLAALPKPGNGWKTMSSTTTTSASCAE